MRLRRVDPFQASDSNWRKNRLHDQPGPEAGKPMQDATLLAEERYRNGNNPEYDGVQPDQGIEDKVRPQEAKPAMFSSWDNRSCYAVLRWQSDAVRTNIHGQMAVRLGLLSDGCTEILHLQVKPSRPRLAWPLLQCIPNP